MVGLKKGKGVEGRGRGKGHGRGREKEGEGKGMGREREGRGEGRGGRREGKSFKTQSLNKTSMGKMLGCNQWSQISKSLKKGGLVGNQNEGE